MFPSWMKLTILSIDSSAAPSPSLEGLAALSSVAVAVPSLPTDDSVTAAKGEEFVIFYHKIFGHAYWTVESGQELSKR